MFNLFQSRTSFADFIHEIKDGKRDLLQILQVSEQNFKDALFEEILSNVSDVVSGVNRVRTNFSSIYFDFFNSCLIKHHDNGDIKYVFFCTTQDVQTILKMVSVLVLKLGKGICDYGRFMAFTEENVVCLAEGRCSGDVDIVECWIYEDITLLLQYKTSPIQQFSLMITVHPLKQKDTVLRSNGTILNLLDIDLNQLFFSYNEIDIKEEVGGQGDKILNYTFELPQKQLNVFDRIIVRIFGEKRYFDKENQTQIILFCSKKISTAEIISVIDALTKIYGPDNTGSGEVALHERDILDERRYWIGRQWYLNENHGLWDSSDNNEKFAYWISASDDEGFKVSVLGYNNLVKFFGQAQS
jgi:predicted CopG family antitoxin